MQQAIEVKFFNPFVEIIRHNNRLPHWQQPGASYFLTYRLADSIPQAVMDRWRTERDIFLHAHPKPWAPDQTAEFQRRFYGMIEDHLDTLHGSCALRKPEIARIAADVLGTFDGERYLHHTWVIMPNHVHVLFTLHADRTLEDEVKSWKGVSARGINLALARSGEFWQRDYFDRMIRDAAHFWRCARYVRRNPAKCGLREGEFALHESEAVREVLSHHDGWR